MSVLPPPSLVSMDGIGCGAVADFELCEPFRWVGSAIAAEDQAKFFAVISFDPNQPIFDANTDPRYMIVENENRVMMLCEPCNEMVVCRDNS